MLAVARATDARRAADVRTGDAGMVADFARVVAEFAVCAMFAVDIGVFFADVARDATVVVVRADMDFASGSDVRDTFEILVVARGVVVRSRNV